MRHQAQKSIDPAIMRALAAYYRRHLLEDIMPFWEARTADAQCGGYLTCFDRQGVLTGYDKYVWLQGRMLWMFSALYNLVEKRPEWLALARNGRDFIVRHAYAGQGRWNYHLDRTGTVKEGTISIYTDHFVLAGLCEYALASGRDEDESLIRATYDTMERNVNDPGFKDIFHQTWSPRFKRHGVYMISLNTAGIAGRFLGRDKTRALTDLCLEQILHVFARDDEKQLFESIGRDNRVINDDPEGRLINPGHALESMWFCIEEGKARRDEAIIRRAIEVAGWAYAAGHDREYGGIFSFLDYSSGEPLQMDWYKETGMLWHDKSFWVHAEAIYTCAIAAVETGDLKWLERLEHLHGWCRDHFVDAEYGEWFNELWRDGSPKNTNKGTNWKAAYHLPRALMKTMLVLEEATGERFSGGKK